MSPVFVRVKLPLSITVGGCVEKKANFKGVCVDYAGMLEFLIFQDFLIFLPLFSLIFPYFPDFS